jgi:glycosyltransferase involved in cell wall biosynthesis
MHICFITSEFPKEGFPHGGVGTFVSTIGKALVEKGIKVSVIGLNYVNKEETEVKDGINVYRVVAKKQKGLQWYFNAKAIAAIIKKVHTENPINIIETAELGLAFLPKIKNIKYTIRLHGGHHFLNHKTNFWKAFQEKKSFKKADAFIAISDFVKTETGKFLSYNSKPIETIYNPISFSKFTPIDNLEIKKNSIVFVGTIYQKKGIKELIQALPFVIDVFSNTTLDIYGRDWLFPDKTSYIEYLKNSTTDEIISKVNFHGVVPHDYLPLKYAQAEVCVFPSHVESQGLVVPEAMAMEKTVIFSEIGIGKETIIPKVSGLLCNPHDPKDIADKILWVFNNPEESVKIGKQAREYALKKYNLQDVVDKNIAFYHQIINC